MCPRAAGASMGIGSRPFLAHHPRVKRAPTRVALCFVEIDFSWDYTKPSRIHMGARSAKLSSGCKDSPTNAFDEAPVASKQALELPPTCRATRVRNEDRAPATIHG